MEDFYELPKINFQSYEEFEVYKCHCRSCPIGKVYNKVVLSDGNKTNPKVVVVGEAPGKDELEENKPFVGKCGKLLRETLEKNGFNETNSLITNLMPCRPENNKFPKDESVIHSCKNMWLKSEIKLLNPDFLLIIGSKPLKFLLGLDAITKSRGIWYNKKLNGKLVRILPTFHPSYVQRTQYSKDKEYVGKFFQQDIENIAKLAGFTNNIYKN